MTRNSTAKNKKIRILSALICDSVRRENNGKEIIIGVYGNDIVYPSLPAFSALTLWMRLKFDEVVSIPVEFRVVGDHGQQIAAPAKVQLVSPPKLKEFAALILEGIPMQIQSPGSLLFQWRLPNSLWETIVELAVIVGTVQTVPPPSETIPTAP